MVPYRYFSILSSSWTSFIHCFRSSMPLDLIAVKTLSSILESLLVALWMVRRPLKENCKQLAVGILRISKLTACDNSMTSYWFKSTFMLRTMFCYSQVQTPKIESSYHINTFVFKSRGSLTLSVKSDFGALMAACLLLRSHNKWFSLGSYVNHWLSWHRKVATI